MNLCCFYAADFVGFVMVVTGNEHTSAPSLPQAPPLLISPTLQYTHSGPCLAPVVLECFLLPEGPAPARAQRVKGTN